jgi:glycolate oxidase
MPASDTFTKSTPKQESIAGDGRFLTLQEFVAPAHAALSAGTWDYLMGGAETETTIWRNRQALDAIAFRPRVLNDVVNVDTGVSFLGHRLRLPVILAPIGSLQDLVAGGSVVPAKAAARFGVLHMLSSVSKPELEEVASAVGSYPRLYQLYVRGDADWVDAHVARVVAAGYAGLALTVDLDYYGRRERDLAKRFIPTARLAAGVAGDPFQQAFTWSDITRIRRKFAIPLMLKGIATAEDARIALDHGVDVIYVSNHGGRQLDHGLGGVAVLPEIVEAAAGRVPIVVDGGIMRGADIVKAVALGASAVGVGRLQGLALAAGGEVACVRMLELLEDEARRCLGLLGVTGFGQLAPAHLAQALPPPRSSWLDSAYPLLAEGY